ncbi:hypothetical protein [Paenibacillus polymyxa]|uniref:hypothetical protein n=1 Tax=Paenibacillus polymyxa TaxID=1406 RepID=UPI001FB37868|nr:hypothetical protein [Paenibacillus polymyxa]
MDSANRYLLRQAHFGRAGGALLIDGTGHLLSNRADYTSSQPTQAGVQQLA